MKGWHELGGILFILFISLLLVLPQGRAQEQQVGKVVGIEGEGLKGKPPVVDWSTLDWGEIVILLDQLQTKLRSKLEVRLLTGDKFVLGEEITIELQEENQRIVLVLRKGSLRVVTSSRPGALIVRTGTAQAQAGYTTGFIVSCGPPTTANRDICLFVGVYGQSQVESLAFPGRPVFLEPQYFTRVRKNRPPDPPQPMSDTQFQSLLSATTVLGTGDEVDRIAMTDPEAAGEKVLHLKVPPPPQMAAPGTEYPIIDQPLPVYDPGQGGHSPNDRPLPEPPLLPPPPL